MLLCVLLYSSIYQIHTAAYICVNVYSYAGCPLGKMLPHCYPVWRVLQLDPHDVTNDDIIQLVSQNKFR